MTPHRLDRTSRLLRQGIVAMLAGLLTVGFGPTPESVAKPARGAKTAKARQVPPPPPEAAPEPVRLLVPPLIKPPAPKPRTPTGSGGSQEILNLPAGKADDTVMMGQRLNLPGGNDKIFLRARGLPVQEVLAAIAEMKSINMVIDPSVGGTVAVDFLDITLNTVMETLLSTNALSMLKMGSAYVIYRSGRYGQAQIRFIPVHFTNASDLVSKIVAITGATGLSGASNTAGGGAGAAAAGGAEGGFSPQFKLIADARTNSLIVHGTTEDIDIVEKLARRFDVLMPSKIFRLTHLTPAEAINLLRSSYFVGAGQGTNTMVSGGGASTGGGGAAAGGAAGASSGGSLTVRQLDFAAGSTLQTIQVAVSEATPRFVPLERDNNLLVIGSKEELGLVEQILPRIDKKRRQVLLRAQIVELNDDGSKTLGFTINQLSPGGGLVSGISNNTGGTLTVSLTDASQVARFQAALNALIASNQAKVLASPTVLAMDNRQSRISTTETVISGVSVTQPQSAAGGAPLPPVRTAVTTTVGVTLEITPRILLDNTVNLFIHPTISDAGQTVTFDGQPISLPRTRDYLTQELRVRDGETIVIGGLIRETASDTNSKVPLLGDLPILGFFFSTRNNVVNRTEVQIYITPEIQPDV